MVSPAVKIRVTNLGVSFTGIAALKDVNLEIEANKILSIIGPANSGKTTFLKILLDVIFFVSNHLSFTR